MRLIDADKIVYSWQIDADGQEHDGVTLESIINKMPTIEPERKRGKWIDSRDVCWMCSECGKWLDVLQGDADMNFCPNCGSFNGEGEQDG